MIAAFAPWAAPGALPCHPTVDISVLIRRYGSTAIQAERLMHEIALPLKSGSLVVKPRVEHRGRLRADFNSLRTMLIASLSDLDDQGVARRRTQGRLDGADVLAQNRYGLGEALTLQRIQIF
jgi:hypothetical protein